MDTEVAGKPWMAHRVVKAKVGSWTIRQVAHHQSIRLPPVFVENHNVCEVVVPTRLHQL